MDIHMKLRVLWTDYDDDAFKYVDALLLGTLPCTLRLLLISEQPRTERKCSLCDRRWETTNRLQPMGATQPNQQPVSYQWVILATSAAWAARLG